MIVHLRPIWNALVIVGITTTTIMVTGDDDLSGFCLMCSGDDQVLEYPNRIIPFFNLPGGNVSPTCQEVADAAAVLLRADSHSVNCEFIQAQASYCGCPDQGEWSPTNPELNVCSLCPDGSKPSLPEFVTPSGDSCITLDWYARHLSPTECTTLRLQSLQELAHMCGCGSGAKDGTLLVGPSCSWCPTNPTLIPPHLDRPALLPSGETCGELFDYFAEWYTKEACIDAASTIHLVAARCECPGVELPVCLVQQNPHLCTQELLDKIPSSTSSSSCECASFCNDQFVSCQFFPGQFLTEFDCPDNGIAISGCNSALVQLMEGTDETISSTTGSRWRSGVSRRTMASPVLRSCSTLLLPLLFLLSFLLS